MGEFPQQGPGRHFGKLTTLLQPAGHGKNDRVAPNTNPDGVGQPDPDGQRTAGSR